MAVEAENGALSITALLHSGEAFTLAIVAPSCIVAIVLTSPDTAVLASPFTVANTGEVHALAVVVAVVGALLNRTVEPLACGDTGARTIRLALALSRAPIGAFHNGAIVASVRAIALTHSCIAGSVAVAVVEAGALAAVVSRPASLTGADAVVTEASARAVLGAGPLGAVVLVPSGLADTLLGELVALAVKGAGFAGAFAGASLGGTVSPGPSTVAEAGAVIADTMARAVVLALLDLAVLASPPGQAGACGVEAVAVVAGAALALDEGTVASVVTGVAHTASTSALSMSVAVAASAQVDCA